MRGDTARLMQRVKRPSVAKAAGFALAAVRETYEETGLMLGAQAKADAAPAGAWQAFATADVLPDLSAIHFIARAITPPKRPRRFDSRFFAADISAVARRVEGSSVRKRNSSNWSGCRSPRRAALTSPPSPRWCWKNCRTAS